ncbi:MAG: tetratricopeptide repeat protein [Anaerolineae bacterium]|nr:tetratricopeptide repeat protein [Anaerolineae bacterium]
MQRCFAWGAAIALLALAGCAPMPPLTPAPARLPTRLPPTPTTTPTPLAPEIDLYYQAGRDYQAYGDATAAVELFSYVLSVDPFFAPAYVERGAILLAQGEIDAALADAQAAIVADPANAAARALLGEVLQQGFDDPRGALAAYERAVELDPAAAGLLFPARWRAASAARLPARMVDLAIEYATAHPDDPLRAYYRGRAFTALGTPRQAIGGLIQALEEAESAALWFALGEAYAADHAWSNALTCYERARTLAEAGDRSLDMVSDTPVIDLFVGLGEAYLRTGECIKAGVMLEYALAVGADRPQVHTLIGQAMICQTPTPTPTPYPWLSP